MLYLLSLYFLILSLFAVNRFLYMPLCCFLISLKILHTKIKKQNKNIRGIKDKNVRMDVKWPESDGSSLKMFQRKFDIFTYDVDSKWKNIPRSKVPLSLPVCSLVNFTSVYSHFAQKPPEIILDKTGEMYVALTIMSSSESVDN